MRKPTKKEFHYWIKLIEELIIDLISITGWIKILIDAIKEFFD